MLRRRPAQDRVVQVMGRRVEHAHATVRVGCHPHASPVGAEREIVRRKAGVEGRPDPRPVGSRCVHDDDPARTFTERDPQSSTVAAEREVVRTEADIEPAHETQARKIDYRQVAGSVVGDVGPLAVGSDCGEMRTPKVAEGCDDPQRVPREHRDGVPL